MRVSLARLLVTGAVISTSAASAHAQDRDRYTECFSGGRRVDCDRDRDARDRAEQRAREIRERSLERARETRKRALERARDTRRELERRRTIERDRALDRAREQRDQARRDRDRERRRWRDDTRTTFGVGGGADIRRFADVNRYVGVASVDFHTRSGLGLRPEIMYGWTDRQPTSSAISLATCATCSATLPVGFSSASTRGFAQRSQMLGVTLNGTYALLRHSSVRPYLLGGIGVVSTREPEGTLVAVTLVSGTPVSQVIYQNDRRDRVDFALNAGSGLELGRGVVRPYVELRYMLMDTQTRQGFSGALPITVGVRF